MDSGCPNAAPPSIAVWQVCWTARSRVVTRVSRAADGLPVAPTVGALGQVGAVLFDFADVGFALVGVRGEGEHGDARGGASGTTVTVPVSGSWRARAVAKMAARCRAEPACRYAVGGRPNLPMSGCCSCRGSAPAAAVGSGGLGLVL